MPDSPIPLFNHEGFLPPFNGVDPTDLSQSSPYSIDVPSLIEQFAFNKKRIDILRGFLKLREGLNQFGVQGHQWLDGSFVETKEHPNDIDVVTFFFHANQNFTFDNIDLHKLAFPNSKDILCDSYLVDLRAMSQLTPLESQLTLFKIITYWHNLFSHTRNSTWKGMLAIPLDQNEDITAFSDLLDQMESKI